MTRRSSFAERVRTAVADQTLRDAVHRATLTKVTARREALAELRNADELRDLAAQIKRHTVANLPRYLEQFISNVRGHGGVVHFAPDAEHARRLICDIARERGLKLAVKAKSMTTEEVSLNAALESLGVRTVETDLGEFIVQIDHDRPSHIVTPIIHKNRQQVAQAMARELGCEYTEDPTELTMIARRHLRDIFRRCDLGITGVNLGVAETGTICLLTNEGNGRMTTSRPRVHIALMGIEKLVPRMRDLPVFLKLIARSTTGQPMGVYTTLITGPRRGEDRDGPEELHVVLLDNGRSRIWRSEFREVLTCVRCGACLNACPVYRNVGGHAYASVYPGPIGSVVTPLLGELAEHKELPRASSLCGACEDACPVRIDIPEMLVRLRERSAGMQPLAKRLGMYLWRVGMESAGRYAAGQRLMRWWLGRGGREWSGSGIGPLKQWTMSRDLPTPPRESFRQLWKRRLANESDASER